MRPLIAGVLLCLATGAAVATGFGFDPFISLWGGGGDTQDVAVGDVNGDRLDDVIVGTGFGMGAYDFSLQLLLQRADGTLAAPTNLPYGDGNAGITVALADLNSDGVSDIVACHLHGLTLYTSDGKGGLTRSDLALVAPADECDEVAFLDVDRDGYLDIVSQSNWNGSGIYYGNGRGGVRATAYLDSPHSGGTAIATGDATGDGIPDLVIVTVAPRIYPVQPTGGFGTPLDLPAPDTGGWGIEGGAVGDFNGDGRDDIAVAVPANSPTSAIWLYVQGANGTFLAPSRLDSHDLPTALLATDLDRDGREDLLLAHTGWYSIGRYLQGISGLGAEATDPVAFSQWRKGLATGDINDDGCTDAVVGDPAQGVLTLHGNGCHLIAARNDFDGDGRSDLLWRNVQNGANAIWRTGDWNLQQAVTAVTNQAWQIAGTGDFDGDGTSDILWHNTVVGTSVIWRSAVAVQTTFLTQVTNPAWAIVGVGDFDGDRHADILWRNETSGANVIWRSGDANTQQAVTYVTNTDWKVAAVADFDGDRIDDLLWRNGTTGADTIWLSALPARTQTMTGITDTRWKIAGAGDFDGDGRADVLWRHSSSGSNAIWYSADSAKTGTLPSVVDKRWVVAAVGDYNGDRKADIAWRNTGTGEDSIWRAAIVSVQWPATDVTTLTWHIVP